MVCVKLPRSVLGCPRSQALAALRGIRRPADLESCRQVHLREPVSRFEDVIQDRIPDLFGDHCRSLFDLGGLIVHVLNRQLTHRQSFDREAL